MSARFLRSNLYNVLPTLYSDMGGALARFSGWRAACFVANPSFVYAFAQFRKFKLHVQTLSFYWKLTHA